MERKAQQRYVRRLAETAQMLEELRWRELRALDAGEAIRAADQLIDAALRVPLPPTRRQYSGLVEFQDILRRVRSR